MGELFKQLFSDSSTTCRLKLYLKIQNICIKFCFPNHLPILFLDIQEFYELTLLDDTKSVQQKTVETIRIANKWEADNVRREVSLFLLFVMY